MEMKNSENDEWRALQTACYECWSLMMMMKYYLLPRFAMVESMGDGRCVVVVAVMGTMVPCPVAYDEVMKEVLAKMQTTSMMMMLLLLVMS